MLRLRPSRLLYWILIAVALVAAVACSSTSNRAPSTPTVEPVAFATTEVRVGGRALRVAVASTAVQSERGLGYRDSLPADEGMIFDLHNTVVPQFWMKGMRFALDLVWIDDTQKVVSVTKDVPPEPGVTDAALKRYAPQTAVRYVIEVNAGAADRLGLTPGAQLAFALTSPPPD